MHKITTFLPLFLIKLYQKTISPDHGWFSGLSPIGFCRFYPSCSVYGYRAIEKYGILKGGLMATWRIMRCNPFSKGGEDKLN